jgi:hypothetical protein
VRAIRDFHALCGVCAVALAAVTAAAPAGAAEDDPHAASLAADPLSRARGAWDRGEFDVAEPLYKEAVERGGLSPTETLDCLVHMGAARAVMGRKATALVAFRQAALLDPRFVVPREAGKKAVALANRARRDEARFGAFQLHPDVPETTAAAAPFRVAVTTDGTHAALISKVAVSARDAFTNKTFEATESAKTSVVFDIPATMSAPSSSLTVRFDALDAHDNRLVSIERKVKIAGPVDAPPVTLVTAPAATSAPPGEPKAKADPNAWAKPIPPARSEKDRLASKRGDFWSSPWPYVIGGVALAAGGAAIYLGTRPTDDVTVGSASVRVR